MSRLTSTGAPARPPRRRAAPTVAALLAAGVLGATPALAQRAPDTERARSHPTRIRPAPAPRDAGGPATVTVAPGPEYGGGGLKRFLAGSEHRDAWLTPLELPVLDLASYAGGLEPEEAGGGLQSVTLHFRGGDGREHIFRSVDKYLRGLVPELEDTPAGHAAQDQISALHPAGMLVVPRLLDAVGIMHATPRLVVMPDDPRLGEFRERFAGMVGMIEERANEGEDESPGFAGFRRIIGTDRLFERLEEAPTHRAAEAEFLRARLVDFVIGDTDRGTDQWRWAGVPARDLEPGAAAGDSIWRPIPVDRDWAFHVADGLLLAPVRGIFKKFSQFGPRHPGIEVLTYTSHVVDRRLLTRLTREDVALAAAEVRAALTDDVIDAAVAELPPELRAAEGPELAAAMKARRDALPEVAEAFHAWLAAEIDVRATDEDDVATVDRRADGSVVVSLASGAGAPPYYERTFVPDDTREIRLYLHGGDDHATVRGPAGDIEVRVIGGGGDDALVDEGGGANLYDHRGDNRFVRARGTRVSTTEWDSPEAPEGLRSGSRWSPDYGGGMSWGFLPDYREGAGLILGAGPSWVDRGFRSLPHRTRVDLRAYVGTTDVDVAADLAVDHRLEASRNGFWLFARGSRLEAFRFYGLGNETGSLPPDAALIEQDELLLQGGWVRRLGYVPGLDEDEGGDEEDEGEDEEDEGEDDAAQGENPQVEIAVRRRPFELDGELRVGPIVRYQDAAEGARFGATTPGAEPFVEAGLGATVMLERTDGRGAPRAGFRITGSAAGYPLVGEGYDPFAELGASAAAYLPLGLGGLHLAMRGGGEVVAGGDAFPRQHAAFLGGRETLRGYRWMRYGGDASAFGGVELRAPLGQVELFVRGELGVFALADAGRVWLDGESPGGWHTAWGGGAWFAAFGRALSIAVADGEERRAYVWLGMPF